ncbi:MAG: leucyl/phenylalanyl-tRNA--protein transferase [Pyrinomonadaceae bacterium]
MTVFPDPRTFDYPEWVSIGDYIFRSHDVVSFGTELTVENVREAYLNGIFPWYTEGVPLPWHCPEQRAILEFSDLKIPRSLEKERRKDHLKFTIDKDFRAVIRECSLANRPGQRGTWITKEFEHVFTQLHDEGITHSVEVWDTDDNLVGGLYGVDAGGVFCGESMFYKAPNASKLALLFLIEYLRSHGSKWLDSQVMTPHFKVLGAKEINREEFLFKLRETQRMSIELFPPK